MVNEWLAASKLTLNVNKSKYVIFGKPHKLSKTPNFDLCINNQRLDRVENMKYLGVTLDENLKFNKHIEIIHVKSVNKLGSLRRARQFLDRSAALTLYQSLVLPQLTYCDVVYETTSKANTVKLQMVQNTAFRCVLKCNKRTPIRRMHNELQILTLEKTQTKYGCTVF